MRKIPPLSEIMNITDENLLMYIQEHGNINEREIAGEVLNKHRRWDNLMENYRV